MPEQTRAKEQKPHRSVRRFAASADAPAHLPTNGVQEGTIQRMLADQSRLSPADVIQLQRSIGNRAVARLLGSSATMRGVGLQPKLQVAPAHDRYEKEANQI